MENEGELGDIFIEKYLTHRSHLIWFICIKYVHMRHLSANPSFPWTKAPPGVAHTHKIFFISAIRGGSYVGTPQTWLPR